MFIASLVFLTFQIFPPLIPKSSPCTAHERMPEIYFLYLAAVILPSVAASECNIVRTSMNPVQWIPVNRDRFLQPKNVPINRKSPLSENIYVLYLVNGFQI